MCSQCSQWVAQCICQNADWTKVWGKIQATDAASDLLQRLTTTPLFCASSCVRCRRCSRIRPRRRRHCCRMHVASHRQNISRCPPRFCSVSCTPSVQHDVMTRRQWTRPCVWSRAQSASSESDSDTLLTFTLFFSFWTLAVYNIALFQWHLNYCSMWDINTFG